MLQAILFDLDGTLLPMDNDYFVKVYFHYLAQCAKEWGYTDEAQLIDAVWEGVAAMVRNDGTRTNSQAFWECFSGIYGRQAGEDMDRFDHFYATEFNKAVKATFPTPLAREAVESARSKAEHVILATNPIFPAVADKSRLSWIGLSMEDFELVTDYDNCCYSKPNPEYYKDLLTRFNLDPAHCLMIGNDVDEDVIAAQSAGITCYLLDDHVINRKNKEVDCEHGSYQEMVDYLKAL